MWNLGTVWGEGMSTMNSSYLTVMHEIHVLLVDHDPDDLINTSKMLEMCQYRVSIVEFASAAISMLSHGKVKINFVLANINSPDLHGFKLLQQAVNMHIPIILMSVDDNTVMAMRAIESGAYLYIKKPATMEMLRCLWQHVVRERLRGMREKGPSYGVGNPNELAEGSKGKSRKGYYKGREDEYGPDPSQGKVKRKVCTEWTQDLHEKFMDAVELLGEGRCFPKEILELMNVPGLTRMQVASHLQKCRNNNWRSPDDRKTNPMGSDGEGGSQHRPRRFGSMPRTGRAPSSHVQAAHQQSESEMASDHGTNNVEHYHQVQQSHGAIIPHHPTHPISTDHHYNDCYNFYHQGHIVDGMIHHFSAAPPPLDHPAYNNNSAYNAGNDQNSSLENRGDQWGGSETSNFGNNGSDNRGH